MQALLRRLEKRILVPLPDVQARRAMLGALLGQRVAADVDLDGVAAATAGYSGGLQQQGSYPLFACAGAGAGVCVRCLVHCLVMRVAADVDLDGVAAATAGYSGGL
jgi:ATP-dependent Zn protease